MLVKQFWKTVLSNGPVFLLSCITFDMASIIKIFMIIDRYKGKQSNNASKQPIGSVVH